MRERKIENDVEGWSGKDMNDIDFYVEMVENQNE